MITLKEHSRERTSFGGDTEYYLEILIDGKETGILIFASSSGGRVDGEIEVYFVGLWEESYKTNYPSTMNVHVQGNITHFKKWVMKNINDILDFAAWHIITIKNRAEEMHDIISEVLRDR